MKIVDAQRIYKTSFCEVQFESRNDAEYNETRWVAETFNTFICRLQKKIAIKWYL